tara:strand:+ start:1817 stop:2185 length:369 start_codon:yes stop_codon:yes gene_type:complete
MLSMKKLLDKVFSETTEFMIRIIFGLVVGISLLTIMFSQEPTEIIPYRLVPSQDIGYGCWLDLEIVAMPIGVEKGSDDEKKIYEAIVKKEMGENGFSFLTINNKQYVLMKIQVPEPFELEIK